MSVLIDAVVAGVGYGLAVFLVALIPIVAGGRERV